MKVYRILGIVILVLVLLGGIELGLLLHLNEKKGQKEEVYTGETIVIDSETEDEFAEEIISLIKEYDGEEISEEAFSNPYYSRRLIVQGTGETLDLAEYGAKIIVCGPDDLYVMQFTTQESAGAAHTKLQEVENIEYCEADQYLRTAEGEETYEAMSWGVRRIGADSYAEHVKSVADGSVTVAVVDSGIYETSILKGRITDGGKDFVEGNLKPNDEIGHGTHVAGTVADCTPGLPVYILPIKVFDKNNFSPFLRVSLGIRYAVQQKAQVINLSMQGNSSKTVDKAARYAVNNGCTVIVSAGNEKKNTADCFPANLKECIIVSAVDESLEKADLPKWGTNWGDSVDVAAPGVNVESYVPNYVMGKPIGEKKESWEGTSMAAPHIAAIAAMIKLEQPSLGPAEIEHTIINNCVDLGEPGWDPYYGWGIPDFGDKADSIVPKPDGGSQIDLTSVYDDILKEYKMVGESNFDYALLEQAQYINEGVYNFSGMNMYSIYYRYVDFDGDGVSELAISVNEKDMPKNIVDIYGIENGTPVRIINNDASVGYRSQYYITSDNRIKCKGSGGALNSVIEYYCLAQNEKKLELVEQYTYDGWNGDTYTHVDKEGNVTDISSEEFDYHGNENDVDHESAWELLYEPNANNTEISINNDEDNEISINNDEDSGNTLAYQGIFMQGNMFISLPLYTSYEPGSAIGIAYCVTEPSWDANGCIASDVIETVGEIYALSSENEYEIRNEGAVYGLSYYDGKVVLTGEGPYGGTYTQISNSGANTNPADIWLNIE